MQYGKPWFRERCEYEACFDTRLGKDYAFYRNGLSGCCWAEALRLASPSVVKERAAAPFQDIVQERNPAGVDVLPRAPGGHMGAGRASPGPLPAIASLAAPGRGCGPRWYDGRDALAGPKDHTH